jgi:hypothetical protein
MNSALAQSRSVGWVARSKTQQKNANSLEMLVFYRSSACFLDRIRYTCAITSGTLARLPPVRLRERIRDIKHIDLAQSR